MHMSRLEQQGADAAELHEWALLFERIGDGMEPSIVMGGVEVLCASLMLYVCHLSPRTEGGLGDSIFGEGR